MLPTLYMAILPRGAAECVTTLRSFMRCVGKDVSKVIAVKHAVLNADAAAGQANFSVTLELQKRGAGTWEPILDSNRQAEMTAGSEQMPEGNLLGLVANSHVFSVTPPKEWKELQPKQKYRLIWRVRHELLSGARESTRSATAATAQQSGVCFEHVQVRQRHDEPTRRACNSNCPTCLPALAGSRAAQTVATFMLDFSSQAASAHVLTGSPLQRWRPIPLVNKLDMHVASL